MVKDIKFVPVAPKTYTVSELRDTQQQPVKKSPLSPTARSKVVNRSGSNYLSEKEGYGPCSYPNVPFEVSIRVEGWDRNWANTGWNAFPGHWKYESHILEVHTLGEKTFD